MTWVEELDSLVKQGKTSQVQARLRRKLPPRLPRKNLIQLASICRRVGMANRGLVLLNRVVRGTPSQAPNPTSAETIEYATCLVHAGAPEEALHLLEDIPSQDHPQSMMTIVFAEVAQWNYAATVPILERYLNHDVPTPYERLVAKANLGAALVATAQYESAAHQLRALEEETRKGDYSLLRASTVQLLAQAYLFLEDWSEAEAALDTADRLLSDAGEIPRLLVSKWRTFMELLRVGPSGRSASQLKKLRKIAKERRQWETLRECDRFEASAHRDERLLLHLYFGTEWAPYRTRILSGFGSGLDIPDSFRWTLMGSSSAPEFEVSGARWEVKNETAKLNQGIHRLIQVLSRDFYRPFRLPELHSRLFPDDFYNPFTSPKRVHRVLGRLRRWLEDQDIPLGVCHEGDRYRWEPLGPIALVVRNPGLDEDARLRRVREHFAQRPFSSLELSEVLGKSRATAQRILNELEETNGIERVHGGKNTRYRVCLSECSD